MTAISGNRILQKNIIALSPEELDKFGANAIQCSAYYGLLIEVKKEGSVYCYKKPTFLCGCLMLSQFTCVADYRINYERVNITTFCYKKVRYDPLSNEEASMCLLDFIPQVVEIVKKLYSEGYQHTDVRIPNICFNENFKAVLIDLDNSVDVGTSVMICNISEQQLEDLITFAYDLEKRIVEYFPDLKADDFFKELCKGNYVPTKLYSSLILKKSTKLVKDIINERAM